MNAYGWHRATFRPFGLGQGSAWTARAREALARYDALIQRAASVSDDKARGEILAWIGDGSVPGSPSDQYRYVRDDVDGGALVDDIRIENVKDLEAVNTELETRVANGEKSGTYGPSGPLSIVTPQGKLTGVGVGLVVVASLSLLAVPMLLK